MKCENTNCKNKIDKANCVVSGVGEGNTTYWCSEECYSNHINCRSPEDKDYKKPKLTPLQLR